jgi:hypothetical protein
MAAALKSKSATRVKVRTAPPVTRSASTSKIHSHETEKSSVTTTRKGHRGKIQTVAVSKPKFHGQQSIDQDRTIEIQQALIREHYLDGEATGEWDQATRDALTRLQNDNHWQTKIVPDARALIKLGLGPSQQNLLNPESAAIAIPYQSGIERSAPGGSN